ncbi:MAG TPA: hypothetical protein VMF67_07255 [Rhizomicrobium sp.]|nr:hypothetical protein [Rhizomicrobium sp.]
MPLFHFSEEPAIRYFEPRPVQIPSPRAAGRDWLNGPLIWAIDAWHQPMYLFPRDCPRILIWPTGSTTEEDRQAWWGGRTCRMIAHIEGCWLERLRRTRLYRYELPEDSFQCLEDAGMWVSRAGIAPIRSDLVKDLETALGDTETELRVMETLTPLWRLWATSLHVSGIRLRNAGEWAS